MANPDDFIGTCYLHMSQISALGENGKKIAQYNIIVDVKLLSTTNRIFADLWTVLYQLLWFPTRVL